MQTVNLQVQSIEDIVDKDGLSIYSGEKVSAQGGGYAVLRAVSQYQPAIQRKVRIEINKFWRNTGRTQTDKFVRLIQELERYHSVIEVILNEDPVNAAPNYEELKKMIKKNNCLSAR